MQNLGTLECPTHALRCVLREKYPTKSSFKKLIANNILPVVLCVPLPLTDDVTETQRHKVCKRLCEQYHIPILSVDLTAAVDSGVVFDLCCFCYVRPGA